MFLQNLPDVFQKNVHLFPGADGDADPGGDLRPVKVPDQNAPLFEFQIQLPAADLFGDGKDEVCRGGEDAEAQLGISIEPDRRDTFPAIALACAYLKDVMNASEEEAVLVLPVDPYVEDEYFTALNELYELAEKGESNLYLLGMEPTYPSAKYGYIIPTEKEKISAVKTFKEKPDEEE